MNLNEFIQDKEQVQNNRPRSKSIAQIKNKSKKLLEMS